MGTALETFWEQTGNMVPTSQSGKKISHPAPLPPLLQKWASGVHVESPHCLIGGMKNLFLKLFVAIFGLG
jgi:hypothetical protein